MSFNVTLICKLNRFRNLSLVFVSSKHVKRLVGILAKNYHDKPPKPLVFPPPKTRDEQYVVDKTGYYPSFCSVYVDRRGWLIGPDMNRGEKDKEILARVKKGEVKFDPADWSDVSSDAIDFIKFRGIRDWGVGASWFVHGICGSFREVSGSLIVPL